MSQREPGGGDRPDLFTSPQSAGAEDHVRQRAENAGEFDVTTLFSEVAEAISPAFAAGEANQASYGGALVLKAGHELTPGVYTTVDISYRVALSREYVNITSQSDTETEEEPTTEERGDLALIELDADEDEDESEGEAPNTIITTLIVVDQRDHEVAELPVEYMDLARAEGWLRDDGQDKFFVSQLTGFTVFISEGLIEREVSFYYSVNGEQFHTYTDIDELLAKSILETDTTDQPTVSEYEREDVEVWDAEVSVHVTDADSETLATLGAELKDENRQHEYAKGVADILWQVMRIPVRGFTDGKAPDRL